MKGVQCYELFGGIALKNHAFSFSIDESTIKLDNWTPSTGGVQLYILVDMHMLIFFTKTMKEISISNNPAEISNINYNEKHFHKENAKDHSVIMKEVDKGGAIVLFNTPDCINSCENLPLKTTI